MLWKPCIAHCINFQISSKTYFSCQWLLRFHQRIHQNDTPWPIFCLIIVKNYLILNSFPFYTLVFACCYIIKDNSLFWFYMLSCPKVNYLMKILSSFFTFLNHFRKYILVIYVLYNWCLKYTRRKTVVFWFLGIEAQKLEYIILI